MPSKKSDYWFPRKTCGWGWGFPCSWQGWLVLLGFFALLIAGALWIVPRFSETHFVVYAFALAAILVAICWRKGEPPGGWHWGD